MRTHVIAVLALVALLASPASATEICGNAIDDDGVLRATNVSA